MVGFCGDGFNDIPAIHAADLGIAVSVTEAAVLAPIFTTGASAKGETHALFQEIASAASHKSCSQQRLSKAQLPASCVWHQMQLTAAADQLRMQCCRIMVPVEGCCMEQGMALDTAICDHQLHIALGPSSTLPFTLAPHCP